MCRRRSPSVMMPDKMAVGIDHADAAHGLGRHLDHGLAHAGAERRDRNRVALAHDIADEFEHGAEPAARMQQAEFMRGESAAFQQRDGERVAERKLHQRRGGRREIVRTSFARVRQHQRHVGSAAKRAGASAVTAISGIRCRRE